MKELKIPARDGLDLSAAIGAPAEGQRPRLILQMIHGALEHKERYYEFAKYLNEQGIVTIISDNRGHGHSVNAAYPLGYMDDLDQMIDDQVCVSSYIQAQYPGLPLAIFGHSLGSMFARIYLQTHDRAITRLVLSGTVAYVPIVDLGIAISSLAAHIFGEHGYSALLKYFNGDDDVSWVSASEENRQRRNDDPLCRYPYQNEALVTILKANKALHDLEAYRCTNPALPILSVSGEGDPVTGGKLGLKDTVDTLMKIGYLDVTSIVYPGMRHEVLNEDDRLAVYSDISSFLLRPHAN